VRTGCDRVSAVPRIVNPGPGPTDYLGMKPLASISGLATEASRRPVGWQVQLRVDYVVNKVMQTHRGQSEDSVKQAIQDQLRVYGVVPNKRQVSQYASAISSLPPIPPAG
jgi:hypothetical protein